MQCFLSSRPKQFSTQQQAIEYMVRSGQVRNVESARVSIIGQIQPLVNTEFRMKQTLLNFQHSLIYVKQSGKKTKKKKKMIILPLIFKNQRQQMK